MVSPEHRNRSAFDQPPTKIAGLIYILLGIFALLVAAMVMVLSESFGGVGNFRFGIGSVVALYGIFRIVTGIRTMRKASEARAEEHAQEQVAASQKSGGE